VTPGVTLDVGVLGLGEAGAAIARGLGAAGCAVRGFDPVVRERVPDVTRAESPADAVSGAALVLSLTTATHALEAATAVAASLTADQLYADLNTTAPSLKRELAALVERTGAGFADVALLGSVPAQGVATPALASGTGAERLAELLRPFGMQVELVGREPGDAAGLKLIRSVFMKGLAASVLESVEAAKCRGADTWLRGEIADVLGDELLERLLAGTVRHAGRRLDEMEAAAAYLTELGVEPRVARATADWLETLVLRQEARP
jgi:3-hydroxyisobutyrate dehydrogenase-like beta-hydroxyacid dehydrogenase